MNSITDLIEKYQGLIKAQTDYLASPEGQLSPEDQRMFATQKAFFYQGFVDELEKAQSTNLSKTGIQLIAQERQEQIEKHGYDSDHDARYNDENSHRIGSDLRYAAMHALWPEGQFYPPKWESWFRDKITQKSYKERLIISGALIAAEIDRITIL